MPIYIDVKHYYETTKNGKLVRRKDIEKEEPTHFLPQKKPTNKLNWLKDLRQRIILGEADLSEFNLFFFYSYTEWPTVPGISHLKIKNPKDSKEDKILEQVWLAEATYQVFLKLNDWLDMSICNEKLQNLISLDEPFTRAIETIENTAREIQNILPSALPNYESRYERGYETFKGVLYNLDKSNDTVVERLGKFQNAVKDFESLIEKIHVKIIKILTRHNSIKSDSDIQGNAGQAIKPKRPKRKRKNDFEFRKGEVIYKSKKLKLPAGETIEIFKKLERCIGKVVEHKKLDSQSVNSGASDYLRGRIKVIRTALDNSNARYRIRSISGVGYVLEHI